MTFFSTLFAISGGDTHSIDALVDVAIVLAACVVFGLIAQKLGQSVMIGYLLSGVVLGGPASFHIVKDTDSLSFMGEVGVALLLFTVGLDLPFEKVRKFGRMALVAGGLQVLFTTVATAIIALAFGAGVSMALLIGVAVSLSSTAIVISVLTDRAETDSIHGLVTTGMLIAQDVIVVIFLLLLPLLPGSNVAGADGSFFVALGIAAIKFIAITAAIVVVERVVLRSLFNYGTDGASRDLLAIASLTISLGAIGACWALDLSPALGGFITGLVMADAAYAPQVRSEIAPIRMGLMAVFFAYVGMVADGIWLLKNLLLVLGVACAIIVGKAVIVWISARIAQVPATAAVLTAAALAQLGEFSFALLTIGKDIGIIEGDAFRLLISVSLITLLVTPQLISVTSKTLHKRVLDKGADVNLSELPELSKEKQHAIVVGAGPSGRAVADALSSKGMDVTAIELNPNADADESDDTLPVGTTVIFGDASRPDVLHRAGIAEACLLVVTVPDPTAIRTIIAQSKQLVPEVPVVARGRYNRHIKGIERAGAAVVVDEETVTGQKLADVALAKLGYS